MTINPVEAAIDADLLEHPAGEVGTIAAIAEKYDISSQRLLGFLLTLSYDEMRIVTCDPWKRKCGGVPRNSFVIVKVNPSATGPGEATLAARLILARVTESVPTPVEDEIRSTIFQVHKVQAILDPLTNKELQWGALKATILGTYYDDQGEINFGNDVDTFLAAHSYEVYVPTDEELAVLINSFVPSESVVCLGSIRYTETPSPGRPLDIPVLVDPMDFIGQGSANRTALFGKTRMGKSNAIKIIAESIFDTPADVAQLIFDPSGEYTYINDQDGTSLFALNSQRAVRYSLAPRPSAAETALGLTPPIPLKINFYADPGVGHALIAALFRSYFPNPPNYVRDVLEWEAPEPTAIPAVQVDPSGYNRGWRELGIWWAVLDAAGYTAPPNQGRYGSIFVSLRKEVKEELASNTNIPPVVRVDNTKMTPQIEDNQPLSALRWIYSQVGLLFQAKSSWFPDSGNRPYFSKGAQSLLRILASSGISGTTYFRPFAIYHHPLGSNIFNDIVRHLEVGTSVFVDYSNAPEEVAQNLSERIARSVFARMVELFSTGTLGERYIIMYFEEAHRLFRADDNDLSSIYNRLAKEGAKFHIGMVYATQSMTTMSPDLLKNTENFIIAHLNDDREVREVTRRYEFRDVAEHVQRVRSRGFVWMITLSHRFALPVQLRKFEAPAGMH
jgi:hypothetical protein